MRWVRSYPRESVPGRSWVVDCHAEAFVNTGFDYTGLAALDDDILLLEWDMAVSREQVRYFEESAADNPAAVLVAPYLLYSVADEPVYAHRMVAPDGSERWVRDYEDRCDYFGFGLVYLPRDLIRRFEAADPATRGRSPFLLAEQATGQTHFNDNCFSIWHRHTLNRDARIEWAVRPIHLHW